MLNALENYTVARKGVGTYFIIFGIVFFFFSLVISIILGGSKFLTGMNWGSFFVALVLSAVGIVYRAFCDLEHKKAAAIYFKSKIDFIKVEFKRMIKVEKDFPVYLVAFSVLFALLVIVGIFLHSRVAQGVLFAVAIMFLGILGIEYYWRHSITGYTNVLRDEMEKLRKYSPWVLK